MRIAVTGATGSLGGALIEALRLRSDVERVVAVSRDEVKSGDLEARHADWDPLRCQLGDVRDECRMEELFRGCDLVVHAAALKRVGHSVYSPGEMLKTNVQGTINVIRAATEVGVGRVVVVSSDKACLASNLYGVTKAAAESYAVQANSYSVPRGTRVSVVRYGNVLGSRGSVVHVWRDALRRGAPVTVTDSRMTRFVITLPQAASFVLRALEVMDGGEVFVPWLPAARMVALANAVETDWHGRLALWSLRVETGLRPGGEKLHESLVSCEEYLRASWHYGFRDAAHATAVIQPAHHSWRVALSPPPVVECLAGPYSSDEPFGWLGVDQLVAMLRGVPK